MTRCVIAFVLIVASTAAIAHEDPIGDIYPVVKVENGNFAIYFYNNALPLRFETKSDLLANTLDNRRNCRLSTS